MTSIIVIFDNCKGVNHIMRKQLDTEKLIEEILNFQVNERKINIDQTAMK